MKAVLFDLDGTLLPISEETFTKAYFGSLSQTLAPAGFDPQQLIKGVWAGTKCMMKNDGSKRNDRVFWDEFTRLFDCEEAPVRAMCDAFYANEFDKLRTVAAPAPYSELVVRVLRNKGYKLVLATNPLFPPVAVETRLRWIGLTMGDFELVTTYENSRYCKPNPGYYRDIVDALGISAADCLMVGNNVTEDMCFASLGGAVYLVTDNVENPAGIAYADYQQGSMADFAAYVEEL